jgi:hypothetical protein
MEKFLKLLDGKKAVIGTALGAVNVYLIATGVFTPELGALIATLIFILTGVGVQQTNKVLGRTIGRSKYN